MKYVWLFGLLTISIPWFIHRINGLWASLPNICKIFPNFGSSPHQNIWLQVVTGQGAWLHLARDSGTGLLCGYPLWGGQTAHTWLLIRFRRLSCSGRIYAVCDVRINGITPVEMWISAPKWGKIQSKFSKNFTFPILSKNHNLINNQKAFCWWYTYNRMFPHPSRIELNQLNFW